MAWLNLNQSFSSIKGQITNFANEVLSESGAEELNPTQQLEVAQEKLRELEALCASQDYEIKALQKQNALLHQEKSNSSTNHNATQKRDDQGSSGEGSGFHEEDASWFWDPPEEKKTDPFKEENEQLRTEVFNVKKQLENARIENKNLTKTLDELDEDNGAAIQKIVDIKNQLQKECDLLKIDYERLNAEHETKTREYDEKLKELSERCNISDQLNINLQASLDTMHTKYDKLEKVHRLLIENTEKFQEENQYMTEENIRLTARLDELSVKIYDLESSYKTVTEDMDKLQEEYQESIEENFKLQEEYTRLQHDLEDAVKNKKTLIQDEDNNQITLEKYRELEEKFSKLEIQFANTVPTKCTRLKEFAVDNSTNSVIDSNVNANIIIEQLKSEIVDLQNKLNTNEEIKRLNLENASLKKELESFNSKNNITCDQIKSIFHKRIPGIDKNLKYSHVSDDVLSYVDICLQTLGEFKSRNETLEIRVSEDSKEIDRLKSKLSDINAEMFVLNNDLTQCEHECSEMKKNNDFLIAEISALKSSSKLEPILEQNEENVLMLQNELEDCSNHKKSIEAELDRYKNELASSKFENERLKVALEDVENKLKTFKSDYKNVENKVCQMQASESELVSSYRKEIENLKNYLHNSITENEKYKIDISIIDNEKILLMKEISELKETFSEEIDSCRKQIKIIETEKEKLSSELYNISEHPNFILIQEENNNLNSKIDECNNIILKHIDDIKQLKTVLSEKNAELQNTNEQLNKLKIEVDAFNHNHISLNEQVSNMEKQIKEKNEAENEIKHKFQNATNKIDLLNDTLLKLEIQNHDLVENCKSLEKKILDATKQEGVFRKFFDIIKTISRDPSYKIYIQNCFQELTNDEEDYSVKDYYLQLTQELNNSETKEDFPVPQKENLENDNLIRELRSQNVNFENTIKSLDNDKKILESQLNEHSKHVKSNQDKIVGLEHAKKECEDKLETLNNEKNELINLIKQKHTENINYHNEIQRLNDILVYEAERYKKLEEINLILCNEQSMKEMQCSNCQELYQQIQEKIASYEEMKNSYEILKGNSITPDIFEKLVEKNRQLEEKCDELSQNVLQEQNKLKQIVTDKIQISDREQSLVKEIERLREHLLEIEEMHTNELIVAEQKCQELQTNLVTAEEKVKQSSSMYTSNSIRANQEVETLRNQLKLIEKQRDDIQAQLYQSEDKNNKNMAALTNLQCVLEQFQLDKTRDNEIAIGRLKKDLDQSHTENQKLLSEITLLQDKLKESNNGLKAAARLSSQLDARAAQLNEMKEYVTKYEDELMQWKQKYHNITSNQQDKVDKVLVKNLIVGFVQASLNQRKDDKLQALRILSTVLDFDEKESEKVGLSSSSVQDESLMQEFVKFVEKETRPPLNTVLPNLLNLGQVNNPHEPGTRIRRTSEIGSPSSFSHTQKSPMRSESPQSQISNESRNSPNQRSSPNQKIINPSAVPILINTDSPVWGNDINTTSGNAILDVASSVSDVITGVNQTRNTQGAILKNVLLDS